LASGRRKIGLENLQDVVMRGAFHHIDLTVGDHGASAPFYEMLLGFLGYRCVWSGADGSDWDLTAPWGVNSLGIKAAHRVQPHDRYAPGLHRLVWRASDRADVDSLYELLKVHGATILDAPALYPKYGPDYYAVFFADPDGLKLEFVHAPAWDQGIKT
jgi:glyoxylase I family protein